LEVAGIFCTGEFTQITCPIFSLTFALEGLVLRQLKRGTEGKESWGKSSALSFWVNSMFLVVEKFLIYKATF